jgi:V/A-type H+/Na+-transporting ATPase subunit E
MGIQVQELIDKIKSEGVKAAQDEAARIVAEAKAKAEAIVAEAQREAEHLASRGKEALARDQAAGKDALAQASRDAMLQLGKDMQRALDRVVTREIKAAYGDAALKEILPPLVASWKKSDSESLTVLLSPEDLSKLEAFFAEKFKAEIGKGGLEFKSAGDIKSGFKVVERAGSAFFDFSSDALAELISSHLNSALAEVVRKAARDR